MAEHHDPKHGLDALAAFARAIGDAEKRRAFENNDISLDDLVAEAGGDATHLPHNVRRFLDSLSSEEMRLLANLQSTMTEAGFVERTNSGATLAKL